MSTDALDNPAAETPEGETPEAPKRLTQEVNINDAGPCRKHVKVVVAAEDISARVQDKLKELMHDVQAPGFRPGKAPRKLVEKQFYKDVIRAGYRGPYLKKLAKKSTSTTLPR